MNNSKKHQQHENHHKKQNESIHNKDNKLSKSELELKECKVHNFGFNTPHSWSNLGGYGQIHINTSDNKHYSIGWNRLFDLD